MKKINEVSDGIRTELTYSLEMRGKPFFVFFLTIGSMNPEFNVSDCSKINGSFQTFLCLDPEVTVRLGAGLKKISVKAAEIQQLYKQIKWQI